PPATRKPRLGGGPDCVPPALFRRRPLGAERGRRMAGSSCGPAAVSPSARARCHASTLGGDAGSPVLPGATLDGAEGSRAGAGTRAVGWKGISPWELSTRPWSIWASIVAFAGRGGNALLT